MSSERHSNLTCSVGPMRRYIETAENTSKHTLWVVMIVAGSPVHFDILVNKNHHSSFFSNLFLFQVSYNRGQDFDDMSSFFPCEIDDAIQYINLGYGAQAPKIVIL